MFLIVNKSMLNQTIKKGKKINQFKGGWEVDFSWKN